MWRCSPLNSWLSFWKNIGLFHSFFLTFLQKIKIRKSGSYFTSLYAIFQMFDLISLQKRIGEFDDIEKRWQEERLMMEETIANLTKENSEFDAKKNDLKAELLSLQKELEDLLLNPIKPEIKEEKVEEKQEKTEPEKIEEKQEDIKPQEEEKPIQEQEKQEIKPEQIEQPKEEEKQIPAPEEPKPEPKEEPKIEVPIPEPPKPEENNQQATIIGQIQIPQNTTFVQPDRSITGSLRADSISLAPAPKKHLKKKKKGAKEAADEEGEKSFTYELKHTVTNHIDAVRSVCFHPTEPFYASGSDDGTIRFVNISPPKPAGKKVRTVPKQYRSIRVGDSPVISMASRGNYIFSGQVNGDINQYDFGNVKTEIYEVHGSINAHLAASYQAEQPVWSIAAHENSKFIVAACADGSLKLIDTSTFEGKSVSVESIPTSVAFDDKGETYAVGCQDGTFLIMKGIDAEVVEKKKFDAFINNVIYYNDGFVAGTADGKILNQGTGETFDAHAGGVTSLATLNGYLLSTGNDAFVKAWKDGENVFQAEATKDKNFGESVYSVSASPSHSAFAVSLANGSVLVFQPKK